MVRSAAKNHADVIVITNPDQHRSVLEALSKTEGNPSGVDLGLRRDLAISAFNLPQHMTLRFLTSCGEDSQKVQFQTEF